ncbi:transporter [bacterium]|nr:transporter [bacterium]
MKISTLLSSAAALLCLALPGWSQSHYLPESAPIRDQTGLPPLPGVYYSNSLMYLDMGGSIERSILRGRVPVDLNINASVFADMNSFVWQTGEKFLGADYGVVAVMPTIVQATPTARLEVGRFLGRDASSSAFGVYDLYFSPLALTWRGDRHQVMFNYGLWAPVGGETSLGYWEHQLQLGGTAFLDEEKSWSVSALGTYEINGYNSNRDYTKGNYFTLEWGVVKNLDPNVTLGLVGYGSWQTSGDSGAGLRLPYDPVRDYGIGLGGELKVTIPEANYLSIALKHVRDVSSFGRLSGSITTLNFSVPIEMEMPSAPAPQPATETTPPPVEPHPPAQPQPPTEPQPGQPKP